MTPLAWLDGRRAAVLQTLSDFVAIPSVSTDPAYAGEVARAASFLAGRLTAAGLEHAAVRPTAGHPVVTADWLHAPGAPTLLVYGHYDVQPPDPLPAWSTPPFTATIRDGRLYGRGASDDKGPLVVAITAIEALLAATGKLPVNIKFLVEGEEEMGSANLEPFVAAHAAELRADFVLSADGATWRADLPTVTVASRGTCALDVTVRGAAKDLHSGRHGGAVANPIQALSRLLASLHGDDGAVAVAGFYDRVRLLSPAARADIAAIAFDEAAYLASVGAPAGVGEAGWSLLERNWIRPTLEFNGIAGGYGGAGRKTVIPATALAKISCRLVPDQDPLEILSLIEQHLRQHCPAGVTLEVYRHKGVSHPYAIGEDHPGLVLAKQVLAELYAHPTRAVRMGASIPIGEIFARCLGIDTVFFSFATSDEDYHAPNEFFRIARLWDGVRAWVTYLERVPNAVRDTKAAVFSR
jgi:acetylornithine deacetylase/succinyl-diaminopimelate desuccinylase-like protein